MNRSISLVIVLIILAAIFYWIFNTKNGSIKPDSAPSALDIKESSHVSTNFVNWREYTAPSHQFKVLMPTLPHNATEDVADPKTNEMRNYQIFVSTKEDGAIFSVYLISFPEKIGKKYDEVFMENFMKEMLNSNPSTQVKDVKMVKFHDSQALDFNLETKDASILGKAFINGQTLYILSETTKPDRKNPQEFHFFVNSFQLMQKTKTQDNIKNK